MVVVVSEQQRCPHCGSVEFDLIKYERGHEGRGWFNRCYRCETEWDV